MKQLLAGILLLPALVAANPSPVTVDKKVICETAEVAFRALTEVSPDEKPFWLGKSGNSNYAMLVDEKTKAWTLIQFNAEMVCIIGVGTDHRTANRQPK